MNSKLIEIAAYTNPMDADFIKLCLEEEGIECFLTDEYLGVTHYTFAAGGVKINVREEDSQKAIELIREFEKSNPTFTVFQENDSNTGLRIRLLRDILFTVIFLMLFSSFLIHWFLLRGFGELILMMAILRIFFLILIGSSLFYSVRDLIRTLKLCAQKKDMPQ